MAFSSRMERLLVAALSAAVNHAVSTDQLAEILWGNDPPPSRDNTLQTYVWRVRQVLGSGRITTSEQQNYCLHLTPDELDALRFERYVADATASRSEPEVCRKACAEALALWRGVAFGSFADDDPFRLEAIRLDETRMFTTELMLECDLALGREEVAVGALEAMAEEYPYRERIWHLLIAALALNGRRVEAIRACQQLERLLSEVGLEPTPEIRELEESILSDASEIHPHLRFLNGSARPS